jgi:hypothetical protein
MVNLNYPDDVPLYELSEPEVELIRESLDHRASYLRATKRDDRPYVELRQLITTHARKPVLPEKSQAKRKRA